MNQDVAIALALYNGGKFLEAQIDSILRQSYPFWKLYIQDDGSSDNSCLIAQTYAERYPEKIVLIKNQTLNMGPTLNFSSIAQQCREPYIMFCDQDDIWDEHKIQLTYDAMQKLENGYGPATPLLIFSDLRVVDEELNLLHHSFWKSQKLDPKLSQDLYSILAQNVVTGCTVMINRSLQKAAFPIPTGHILHDHWLAIQACYHGKIGYIDQPLVSYRQHGNNTLGTLDIGINYFLKKILFAIQNLWIYQEKYRFLGFPVNPLKIIYKKTIITLKRLIG